MKVNIAELQKQFEDVYKGQFNFTKAKNGAILTDLECVEGSCEKYLSFFTNAAFEKYLTVFGMGYFTKQRFVEVLNENVLQSIDNWFNKAKPKPSYEDLCVQIGCHYEEVAECLHATGNIGESENIEFSANLYKEKDDLMLQFAENIPNNQVEEMLDALADQIVTAVGVLNFLHRLGYVNATVNEVLQEINFSNYSKFDENGNAIFDENGKIKKSENYVKPDLKKFLRQ